MTTEDQGTHAPRSGKSTVWRVYVLGLLGELALLALLRRAHVSWGVIQVLLLLFLVLALLGKHLTGLSEHIQISFPVFEQRIQNRYGPQSLQLTNLGFSPLFFYGEAFPLIRVLLVFPAILFLTMWLNGEVATFFGGSKLLFGYPVFISQNRTAYAYPSKLGMKFHTAFQDGTVLMTKNFGGKSGYGPPVIAHILRSASISNAWTAHQAQIKALEANGQRVVDEVSFQIFSEMSRNA
ncbi:MAG: hypothetical protein WBQ94_24045 [Terracidiphilus sp.]